MTDLVPKNPASINNNKKFLDNLRNQLKCKDLSRANTAEFFTEITIQITITSTSTKRNWVVGRAYVGFIEALRIARFMA